MSERSATESREELISDVKQGLSQVEDMLREAASTTGDKAAELRDSALDALKSLGETLADVQYSVRRHSRAAVRATDDFVHENPWRALGIAAAAGLLVGLLISRR